MKLNKSTQKKGKSMNKRLKIAIILPRFNDILGTKLLNNTIKELNNLGVKKIETYRVPGTLELPFAALKIALSKKFDGIIALGVVIRGETKHFELVTQTAYQGLMEVVLDEDTPIIFGVLAVENEKQAKARLSKGKEFAQAAVEMATFHA